MPTCFVIQPFDSGKFDKRFDDIYEPAIKAAGLDAYRVDRDPSVEVPIEAIEDGIRNAAICLADITTDNPNVWYELGFAFAAGRPVIMACSAERTGKKFPFDIQHRTVINYTTDSPSDFDIFKRQLVERIKALLTKNEALRQIAESEQIAPTHGLSQPELMVLAVLAANISLPNTTASLWSLKNDAERSGVTAIGFALGVRRLTAKEFVEIRELPDERGEIYDAASLTEKGWNWIENNESLFVLRREAPTNADGVLPF